MKKTIVTLAVVAAALLSGCGVESGLSKTDTAQPPVTTQATIRQGDYSEILDIHMPDGVRLRHTEQQSLYRQERYNYQPGQGPEIFDLVVRAVRDEWIPCGTLGDWKGGQVWTRPGDVEAITLEFHDVEYFPDTDTSFVTLVHFPQMRDQCGGSTS